MSSVLPETTIPAGPAEYDDSALLGVYKPAAPVFVAGRGSRLIDADGREYLDFTSGIGVNALGYGDDGIAEALAVTAASGLLHASNLFRTEPAAELARELASRSFASKVFFCNSGAEANEAAFKFARRWAGVAGGEAKHEIVALHGSFHGRLFGSLAATDRPAYQQPFRPLMPGVRFIAVGDEMGARAAISTERTAAVIAEPVQGEGGVHPIPAEFLRLLRDLTAQAGAALILDEVQCGLGRTGRLFAHETTGVVPDMVTLAKPLAGGLPMGAVLLTDAIASAIVPGDHASTFGGGPAVSRVALEVLRRLAAPEFLAEVRWKGERLRAGLERLVGSGVVVSVRGVGLMLGIELGAPAAPRIAAALDRGLLLCSAGERVVRLLPPLAIEPAELDAGLEILAEVLA
ncbi:MAG TPA: acetylornithine/succinylornithine family transaminase [Longimicrobiales bacterium]|nr:acetylornithine/succinylornithine family transaminase [Longimicrobiales bacterium]